MFRKLSFLIFAVPLAIVLILLSVANRGEVMLNLDPFNAEVPAYSLTMPLFVLLFATLIFGILLGSMITWWKQGRHRKMARKEHVDAVKWHAEADAQKQRADELAGKLNPSLAGLPVADRGKAA